MEKRNIKAIAMTGEKSTKESWKQVADGKYNVLFAAPEAIFEKTGYFWNNVLRKRGGDLYSRIVGFAIDECHCVKNWGGAGFRIDYASIGTLREAFPKVPFMGLTATITPTGISYFFKSTKFKNPAIIRQTIRRTNVDIWVAPLKGKDFDDLRILFPENISCAEDIPQTIVFYNARVGCGRMARWLRSQLPSSLQDQGEMIVRNFSGVLDEASKEETLEQLRSGACRIVVCTDAFGLGMNIRAIPRVIVWKLDAKVGIDSLYQRTGRAGRDTGEHALALIFVSKANLSGQYKSPTRKVADSRNETTRRKTRQTKNPTSVSPTEAQVSTTDDDGNFRYTLPVSRETEPIFRKALPDIYASPTKKACDTHSESNLTAGVHWVVQIDGCRQQPFLVAFNDPEMMRTCDVPGGCDKCRLRQLMETDAMDSPPTLHGIPFIITLAYQQYIETSTDKSRKKRKQTKHTISTDRMDKLIADIQAWRKEALQDWVKPFPEMTIQIAFPDSRIVALAGKVKNVQSEDDLITALKECGYSIPASFITAYTKDLYSCISNSLKESHPLPQLQEQFDKAAGRISHRCRPVEPQAAGVSISTRNIQSAPSMAPAPQQQAQVPSIDNRDAPASRTPYWPIPSIPPTPPSAQRVPLAEKHDLGAINIPVDQLPVLQTDTRLSATGARLSATGARLSATGARLSTTGACLSTTGRSMAAPLLTVSSTSLDPVTENGANTPLQKHPCERDHPGKENCVHSIPAGKKRKRTQP